MDAVNREPGGSGFSEPAAEHGWISVPAAAYFLWVVHALYRGSFHDWNGASGGGSDVRVPQVRPRPQAIPGAAPVPSPVDASTSAVP